VGKGGDSTRLFTRLASLPIIPLVGHGEQIVQPVTIDDIAEAVANLVNNLDTEKHIYNMVGPDVMTMREMYAAFRQWVGKGRAHFLPGPIALIRLSARLNDYLKIGPLNSETLDMLEAGSHADKSDIVKLLHREPQSLQQYFSIHPHNQIRQ
jgi:uncharacterized protein YbjT (DUF2867 family)